MIDLKNKTVLITGASRGVGAAAAESCMKAGARVLMHYGRDRKAAEAVAEKIGAKKSDLIEADLNVPEHPAAVWAAALDRAHRIDVLVNNAGIFQATPVDGADLEWIEGWRRTLQVNLLAPAHLCRAACAHFSGQGGGIIINVASRAGQRGDDIDHSAYAASKGGLLALTKTIARGSGHKNVLAYGIAPGWIETRMGPQDIEARANAIKDIPLGRVASPEEIGELIAYLSTGTVPSMTGATIDVNGASYVR